MPRTKKRGTILGCKLNGSPAGWAKTYAEDFVGVGNYPTEDDDSRYLRWEDIRSCLGLMALHHLGYKLPADPQEFLNRGVDVVVNYFTGDWWKNDEIAAREMDKSKHRRGLKWFDAFSKGLLLGLLSERWDDLAKVCCWVETGIQTEPDEYLEEDFEYELGDVYKSVAVELRSQPMHGLRQREENVLKSTKARPKLLLQAWHAARVGNQADFEENFRKSLEFFTANYGSGDIAIDWIAMHESVVGMAAMRLGIHLPKLPPKLEAVVMTRDSIRMSE